MTKLNNTNKTAITSNTVLVAGFSEDDVVEGVFLLKASSKYVFFNRKNKLEAITGFTGDAYEEDEEGGIWKVITTGVFDDIDELKTVIEKMKKYDWFFGYDSNLLLNGEEIYSEGEWLA